MLCHAAVMAERHFAFEAFRISVGKEGENGSQEVCGENSAPAARGFYSFW